VHASSGEVVMEDEVGSLIGRPLTEPAVELISFGQSGLRVGRRWPIDREQFDLDQATTTVTLGRAIAAADEQAMESGLVFRVRARRRRRSTETGSSRVRS
jgi:hypothetical protein